MLLKDYAIPKERIPLPGPKVQGEQPYFEIRGLNIDDLTFLVQLHLDPVTRAVKLYQESRKDIMATGNLSQFVLSIMRDFPGLTAEVISAAADSLDDATREVAQRLPVSTQTLALTKIVSLTLEDAGGLGNLLAEMRERMAEAVQAASVEGVSANARPKTK